jgi:hypothetical protein
VPNAQFGSVDFRAIHNLWRQNEPRTTSDVVLAGEEGFELRSPDPEDSQRFVNGGCDLSVARTRILSFRRAIRLNTPTESGERETFK